MIQPWEYGVLRLEDVDPEDARAILDRHGSDGWEVISVDNGTVYFKRPVLDLVEDAPVAHMCNTCEHFSMTRPASDPEGRDIGTCDLHGFMTKSEESCDSHPGKKEQPVGSATNE